jgi:hypothetical protein
MEAQAVVALVIGIIVVLFVPALVWSTALAGLYQVVRNGVRASLKAVTRRAPARTK